jgi:hypothetical protein
VRKLNLRNIFLLVLMFSPPVLAKLDFEDHAFPEFITSARALAMGNAYINKVDDSTSAFYNPAGLGSVRKAQFHILNTHFEINSGLLDVVSDGPILKIPDSILNSFNEDKLKELILNSEGQMLHSRVNLFPNLTIRGLTLGYLYSQRSRAVLNYEDSNSLEVIKRKDHGPVGSFNFSMYGGVLKFGVTAVYLNRKDLYKSFGPLDEIDIKDSDYHEGTSLQVTVGSRFVIPMSNVPTFSAVLRNATGSGFNKMNDEHEAPETIKQTLDLGFSITPMISRKSRLHFEVNLKDVNNSYETNARRRLAAGVELDIKRNIFFRAGWGDGWGAGGFGLKLRRFVFDISTYAVDLSRDGFREEEDRRWVMAISTGF